MEKRKCNNKEIVKGRREAEKNRMKKLTGDNKRKAERESLKKITAQRRMDTRKNDTMKDKESEQRQE